MKSFTTKLMGLLVLASLVGATASTARAENEFKENHPRRAEINKRIHNQRKRIKQEVKEGELSKSQAKADNQQLNAIKKEERTDVKNNGGYLTKQQQNQMNQQLNQTSKTIGQ